MRAELRRPDGAEERIGDVGDDHADVPRLPRLEASGKPVGRVAELLDRPPYDLRVTNVLAAEEA